MEASPLETRVSPQTIKVNGTTLLRIPMTINDPHNRGDLGIGSRRTTSNRFSNSAASPTRPRTTVKGGNSATSTLKNKNEQPQSADSTRSNIHSQAPMTSAFCGAGMPIPFTLKEFFLAVRSASRPSDSCCQIRCAAASPSDPTGLVSAALHGLIVVHG